MEEIEKDYSKFDTKAQYLKYKILREVAYWGFKDALLEHIWDIPRTISPGTKPTMRCCVYKERAISAQRVKLAMGGTKSNPNIVEVIDIACDECPLGGYFVTDICRGCISHKCMSTCPRGAISIENQKAVIDKTKCVECGQCAGACPYSAIITRVRPCEKACKVKAISATGENFAAHIDNSKCINCGACVYQCPFGAIVDSSYMINCIDILQKSKGNEKFKVYAIVAPSIASQFNYASIGQLISGIKKIGFCGVKEAAMGADVVTINETKELAEKGFLTSSCCPAFVSYVEKEFPELKDHVSHNPSPMVATAKMIKEEDPACKTVFIGPCTAKKVEQLDPKVSPYIDCAITFEELEAMFGSQKIEIEKLEESELEDASPFGRAFARSGGLSEAIAEAIKEQGLDIDFQPVICNGIEECRRALLMASKGVLKGNFIEGMACPGGCIGGAGCLTHDPKHRKAIDDHADAAGKRTLL